MLEILTSHSRQHYNPPDHHFKPHQTTRRLNEARRAAKVNHDDHTSISPETTQTAKMLALRKPTPRTGPAQ